VHNIRVFLKVSVCGAIALVGSVASGQTNQFRLGKWDLTIGHDHFTGKTNCSLSSSDRRLAYQPGAIGFLVGKRVDTASAWFRVDAGPPIRWQDREAGLISSGVEIDGPGIDNPTGGWVWIPVGEVDRASLVIIRPSERGRIREFRIGSFAAMKEIATRLGCKSYALPRI
jgi:hypothetical protein